MIVPCGLDLNLEIHFQTSEQQLLKFFDAAGQGQPFLGPKAVGEKTGVLLLQAAQHSLTGKRPDFPPGAAGAQPAAGGWPERYLRWRACGGILAGLMTWPTGMVNLGCLNFKPALIAPEVSLNPIGSTGAPN